jgi:hypothetical protein
VYSGTFLALPKRLLIAREQQALAREIALLTVSYAPASRRSGPPFFVMGAKFGKLVPADNQ